MLFVVADVLWRGICRVLVSIFFAENKRPLYSKRVLET